MRPTLPRLPLIAAAGLIAACGTGATPSSNSQPASTGAVTAPAPNPTAVPATPMATSLAGTAAVAIPLPADTSPIDVAHAFGAIWVSSHHRDVVFRIDPATLAVVADIQVASGPGWFATTEDALWVSSQMGRGMTRIDPATNAEVARAGMWPTCNAPIVALGSVWQMACDAHQLMRIDPATNHVVDTTITGYEGIAFVKGDLILTGPTGMARFDPATGTITPFGGAPGWLLGFDDTTVWVNDNSTRALRVDAATGERTPIAITYPGTVRTYGDHAWMIQESTGVSEIDLATNSVLRSIPVRYEPVSAIEAEGYLWVTSYGSDTLWRITP